jgi:hypothetical protein
MKCVVHLDMDLMPKKFDTAEAAIEYVENHLQDSDMLIKWRVDELYPDNFCEYTNEKLLQELLSSGEVTLQLIGFSGEDMILGAIANIVTENKDKEEMAEAQAELEKIAQEFNPTHKDKEISICGGTKRRKLTRKKK